MNNVDMNAVNHPSHYNREGGIECFEEIAMVLTKEQLKGYILGNVWKYRYRASSKNGEEDLCKSDWYMKKYKELFSCIEEDEEYDEEEDEEYEYGWSWDK